MRVKISGKKDSRGIVFDYWFWHDGEFTPEYVWERMNNVFRRSSYDLRGSPEKPIIARGEGENALIAEVHLENRGSTYAQVRVIQQFDFRDAGMTQMIRKALKSLETK